jgi:chromosome segregation ATPase
VLQPDELPSTGEAARSAIEGFTQRDYELLRRELAEAQTLGRGLRRQLEKALQSATEAQRAHAKMVATLTETMRENTTLANERDVWRARAQRLESGLGSEPGASGPVIDVAALAGQISEDEINAIRKAMARLHHPDVGGDPERMKAWNAALDRLGS